MNMTLLADPRFTPNPEELALLNAQLAAKILRDRALPLSGRETARLSEQIAERATLALLRPLVAAGHEVVDANVARRNQPGYDILIDGRVRLQVKGSCTVECVDWTQAGYGG